MSPGLLIFWSYVKKYWHYAVIVVLAVVGFFLFNTQRNTVAEALAEAQKRHDDELKAIREAMAAEEAKRAQNQKVLQETLIAVEKQYQDSQKQLDDKKRAEIKKIVEETHDDPEELARRLQESTGFKIVAGG